MHKINLLNMLGYKGETWNPIVGCSKISAGCANCYAEKMACRLAHMGVRAYQDVVDGGCKNLFQQWNGKTQFVDKSDTFNPLRWKKPRMIFVCSMGDLFHENTPDEWIDMVFAVMALCPQHVFVVLTKRAERMNAYCTKIGRHNSVDGPSIAAREMWLAGHWWYNISGIGYYLPNVWLGVTAENQEQVDERIPRLLETPAAVRFVSCEPMLEQVDLKSICIEHNCFYDALNGVEDSNAGPPLYTTKLDWVICGCESGTNRRDMIVPWADMLQKQCTDAGVPFYMKQMEYELKVCKDIEKFPKNLRVREWPKI